jgi:hypothetical protein
MLLLLATSMQPIRSQKNIQSSLAFFHAFTTNTFPLKINKPTPSVQKCTKYRDKQHPSLMKTRNNTGAVLPADYRA